MQCSRSVLVSWANKLKNYVKFISSANQEIIDSEEKLFEGLDVDTDTEKSDNYEKKPRVIYSSKHFEAVTNYFNSKKCLQDILVKVPPHFLLRTYKCPHSLYFIDKDIAKAVFSKLEPHLVSNQSHILEVNAGVGVLTKYLLKSNLPKLRIYEADSAFFNELYIEVLRRKTDAKVFKFNLLKLWSMMRSDRNDNRNRVDAAFDGLPFLSWEDEPVAKIIAIVPSESFILHIIQSIIFNSGICVHGRPELFLTMPPHVYKKFMAGPDGSLSNYRSRSVLFQLIFECEVLKSISEEAIMPWVNRSQTEKDISLKYGKKYFLVKMTPRQDLFQKIPPHLIKPFWFFVRVLMQKRKDKVISVIERWMPGTGVRLIAQGYTIYTTCGSLKPEQILDLFKEFSSWPEYELSSFTSSMEGLVVRMSDPGEAEVIMTETEKRSKSKDKESSDNIEIKREKSKDKESSESVEKS